jgi:Segregation and condensation complex subunit ScpB
MRGDGSLTWIMTVIEVSVEARASSQHADAVTRRRIDELRGLDSAEAVAQLVEWAMLSRQGAKGRSPLYAVTGKLLEVTGTASVEDLGHRSLAAVDAVGR